MRWTLIFKRKFLSKTRMNKYQAQYMYVKLNTHVNWLAYSVFSLHISLLRTSKLRLDKVKNFLTYWDIVEVILRDEPFHLSTHLMGSELILLYGICDHIWHIWHIPSKYSLWVLSEKLLPPRVQLYDS